MLGSNFSCSQVESIISLCGYRYAADGSNLFGKMRSVYAFEIVCQIDFYSLGEKMTNENNSFVVWTVDFK